MLIASLNAGTLELQPKETAPPTITESQPWQFTIAAPGWMASMNGTIGVRGVNADLDVGFFDDVLEHLDMIFAMRAEAQKGPFGIFGEIIYLGLSDDAQINGLINNVHEQVDLTLVDGALSWRLVNQPRWSLDFAAGMHYTSVYEQLELHNDPAAIQQASQQFVTNISDDLRDRLNNDISQSEFLASLTSTIQSDIVSQIDKHEIVGKSNRRSCHMSMNTFKASICQTNGTDAKVRSKPADKILTLLSPRMDRFLHRRAVIANAGLTVLLARSWLKF